jgi:hypothetical protein
LPVAVICRVLHVSTSGYYDWCSRGPSDRDHEQALLLNEIHDAHKPPTARTAIAGSTPNWYSANGCRSAAAAFNG